MNEQANDFKPYLKKALVLLMAVVMVFTYMPSMTWADIKTTDTTTCPVTITTAGGTTLTATATDETISDTYITGTAKVYEVAVPVADSTVEISGYAAGNFLTYNYDSKGNWLAGYYEDSGSTGVATSTVSVDADEDNVADYVYVQTPYVKAGEATWATSSFICAIKFVYEMPVTVKAGANELTCTRAYANGYNCGIGATDLYVIELPENTDEVAITRAGDNEEKDIVVYNYEGTTYRAEAVTNSDKSVTAKTHLTVKYDTNWNESIVNEGTAGNYLSVQEPWKQETNGNWTGGGSICAIKLVLSNETLDTDSVEKIKGTLTSQTAENGLGFYKDSYGDYSMLGNNWFKGNELKAQVGETAEELDEKYAYLNATTSVPTGWDAEDMDKLTLKWYYGKTYSADGTGYECVTIGGKSTGLDKNNEKAYKNEDGFEYSNQYVSGNYGTYYWFTLIPETVEKGNYYYYVEISYTDSEGKSQRISSKDCQAWVIVSDKTEEQSSGSNEDITVSFKLNGFDGMKSIAEQSVTTPVGSTVGTVFEKVLIANGYKYTYKGSNYISEITDSSGYVLGEFDRGSNSGWMYLVNNQAPTVGLKSYKLSNGDNIVWYYTGDYTKDSYARSSMSTTTTTVTTDTASGAAATTAPTETKVTEKVNADGTKEKTVAVTVSADNQTEIIKQAADKKSTEIVLEVASTATNGAQNVQLQLNVSFVKNVSEKTDAALTVNTENGTVSLDQDTIKTVLDEAKGAIITLDVNKVEKPTEVQKKAAGESGQILSLTVKSGDKTISDFKTGKVTVTVAIQAALQNKRVAAIHIAEDGKIQQMPGKSREVGGKKCYEFTTSHFSDFALVDADELGLETEDEIDPAALATKLTPVARSAKTAKGYIKVTTNLDKSDKAIISQLKDAGYTVKYRFYRSTKKSANYKSALTKQATTYTNTTGKKGTKYFYKVQVRVYDESGKLVAKTALKQCKYACRTK